MGKIFPTNCYVKVRSIILRNTSFLFIFFALSTNQENNNIMTLQAAYAFFESLKKETTNKSEIKVYDNFLDILTRLKNREFTKDELQSIEKELDRLDLKPKMGNNKKYFNKMLKDFRVFLKEKHSLISAGYYVKVGVSIGAAFGVVLGVILGSRFERSLGIAVGISVGIVIGLFIDRKMDTQAKASGTIL
ncbi:hypothetical protein [Aequorivita marisscotiae]|uniref:Glycine zipper family protein n=1 Tax=Aequorivita marisscotiae TaxID=3040348 RepID=A0ABY8KT06_9FLAO|nr:hypothetical protein [Aequorivita sp. Ant34-E75]WGF91689.1 hypothetical protein QCQ61_10765 [Aequorivita sp. Ant34-E75]